jgi:hypothetical protein
MSVKLVHGIVLGLFDYDELFNELKWGLTLSQKEKEKERSN